MNLSFSALNRVEIVRRMAEQPLDLLVIGGGITGAGIAWDASVRGMRTGLVEMNDFASGTSSRSTKLVHGGLRYLKQGEVKLVMEVGRERALLHQNAPHIVIPAPMLLPIYEGGTYGYWASSIGLYVYDLLAGVKRSERRRMFGKEQTMRMEPLLKTDKLKGSGYYYEYRTDDARLTVEILKSAHAHGAHIVNYAKAEEFLYDDSGKVIGVKVRERLSGKTYDIYAKKIVNAAGPWVDQVRSRDGSLHGKKLLLTKGVHLVVDYRRLPVKQAAYFDVPDGRMIFVIPRDGKTYIGTTDTVYKGPIEDPRTTKQDLDYLINAVNAAFPAVRLKAEDVESSWSGLRPLIFEEGKGPSEISRKDEIFVSNSGLITIAGGKLTGFRKMAEKVVDLAAKQLQAETGRTFPPCATDKEIISGGDRGGYATFDEYKRELLRQGQSIGLGDRLPAYLLSLYGANVVHIYQYFATMEETPRDPEEAALRAEIAYCAEHEMAVSAVDFLLRRTGMLLFDRYRAERIIEPVVRFMGERLGWDAADTERERGLVLSELEKATQFPDLQDR